MEQDDGSRKIGLIDDHRLVLDGLEKTLASLNRAYDVVTASSPIHILDRLEQNEIFDLIICDLIMDGMNGLAFLGTLKSRGEKTPVLLMSGIAMDPPFEQMKALGAKGFVHKSADPASLEAVIGTILSGGTHFLEQGAVQSISKDQPYDHDELEAINNLTDRQQEVLRALSRGATNQEISDTLSISPNTVKTHIKNIYDAMGVSSRTTCVQKARLYGLI